MAGNDTKDNGRAVPNGRLSRLFALGGMAGDVAGGVLREGASRALRGEPAALSELIFSSSNAGKISDRLARMRGAAMKVGQLISMDAGDVLPAEIAAPLARLRDGADPMSPSQLNAVLKTRWGADWYSRFSTFSSRPIAAASIGQVHRATSKDGRELAIKIQYPGIRESIDSDIANIASLFRYSGLLPKQADISPLLNEARRQLHEEADYEREARELKTFGALLAGRKPFRVPQLIEELSGPDILAMSFEEGVPIETLSATRSSQCETVVSSLIELFLVELFEFGRMQTDPNFANYRFDPTTGEIVLLDFGATSSFSDSTREHFRALMEAGLAEDRDRIESAMTQIGYFDGQTKARHRIAIMDMFETAMKPVTAGGMFDFANADLVQQLREKGLAMGTERDFWHIPPVDTLFLHRKMAGLYLLAQRLRVKLDLRDIVERFRERSEPA